ncbi:MAG TPA: hypothetical protein VKS78_07395 [Roseiarcus sp.]|nr:hypothetical protein [Roseiarcus sp.]
MMRRSRSEMPASESDFDMPNPFSRVVPDADLYLNHGVLDNKPEMAALICKIFAVWASIEHELEFLLIRITGSDAAPAIAIYETLTADRLQMIALEAAAGVSLSEKPLNVFTAVLSIVKSVQTA